MGTTSVVFPIIITLAAVIATYIFIMPKRKDGHFSSPVLQALHNWFHFKKLYIESIMKFCFVFATIAIVVIGFVMLFKQFLVGLLIMLVGPFALRIVYEFMMMTVLLIQNVIEINTKLGNNTARKAAPTAPAAPVAPPAPPAPVYRFCPSCGTKYDANTARQCPACGRKF